jgi:hypothetical protein
MAIKDMILRKVIYRQAMRQLSWLIYDLEGPGKHTGGSWS